MTEFTSWQVYDLSLYNNFAMEHTEDVSISASLLIPLDSNHQHTGAFRFIIYGGEVDYIPFPVEDIFPDVPDPLKGLFLNLPCDTNRIKLPENSTACVWEDAELMIRNVKNLRNFIPPPPTRVSTEFRRHGILRNFLTSEVIFAQFRRNCAGNHFRIPRNAKMSLLWTPYPQHSTPITL